MSNVDYAVALKAYIECNLNVEAAGNNLLGLFFVCFVITFFTSRFRYDY